MCSSKNINPEKEITQKNTWKSQAVSESAMKPRINNIEQRAWQRAKLRFD